MKLPVIFLLSCLGLVLVGCGQKGPLYLPSKAPEQGSGEQAPVKTEGPIKEVPAKTETPADAIQD